jgi:hypothetical protein
MPWPQPESYKTAWHYRVPLSSLVSSGTTILTAPA